MSYYGAQIEYLAQSDGWPAAVLYNAAEEPAWDDAMAWQVGLRAYWPMCPQGEWIIWTLRPIDRNRRDLMRLALQTRASTEGFTRVEVYWVRRPPTAAMVAAIRRINSNPDEIDAVSWEQRVLAGAKR